jgi:excisionase family DNA binding protein
MNDTKRVRRRARKKTISVGDEKKEWLTADDVAEEFGFPSRNAVYQARRDGRLPAYRMGQRKLLFKRTELEQKLLQNRTLTPIDDLPIPDL